MDYLIVLFYHDELSSIFAGTKTNDMTIEQAKETFLFGFIKGEMEERNTTELTRDVLNAAYQKLVKFYQNEECMNKLKGAVKFYIKNGK